MRGGEQSFLDCGLRSIPTPGRTWYFQFTPTDEWDYDSVQVHRACDLNWRGSGMKACCGEIGNAFYRVNRENGEFLLGNAFVKQTCGQGSRR